MTFAPRRHVLVRCALAVALLLPLVGAWPASGVSDLADAARAQAPPSEPPTLTTASSQGLPAACDNSEAARRNPRCQPPAGDGPSSEWPCPDWGMYGRGLARTFSTDCASPIDTTSVRTLVPAWFFKTPEAVTASPVVVEGVLYVGAWDGRMYALDAASGGLRWSTPTVPAPGANWGPIVSSAAVADVPVDGETRRLVVFGAGPRVYALDAEDGSEVWVLYVGAGIEDEPTQVESSPVVWNGTVYVGMDTHNAPGERTGGVRGGLLAIDAATGELRWRFDPELDGPAAGCGGVWSSALVDTKRGLVVFGSANCYERSNFDWTPYTVATTALDAVTGEPVWSFQPNPPPDRDLDFGATPNLFTDADGREILGAASKDGHYYGLDPSTGALLWAAKAHDPVDGVGGFIGSPAAWDGRVFGGTGIGEPPYYHAIDGRDGTILWEAAQAPSYGASAVVNGVVFSGPLDDLLRAYDADTGLLLWAGPLSAPPSSGPAIVGDSVYIGAGTSSTDLCAKGSVYDEPCRLAFDGGVRQTGGVHAFRLAPLPTATAP